LGYVSDDTLDLSFLSQLSAGKTEKTQAAPAGKEFLPSVVTLPRDINIDAKLNIATVTYGNAKFNDAAIVLLKDKSTTEFDIALAGQAQNKLLLNTELKFGSRSVSPKSGQVSYADPVVKIDSDIHLDDPVKFMKGFGANYPADIEKIFIEPLNVTIRSAAVKPDNIDFGDVKFSVLQNSYTLSGSFAQKARPVLALKLRGDRLDVNKILGTPSAAQKAKQTQSAALEETVRQSLQALQIPLDINFDMGLSTLIYQKYDLRDFVLSGALSDNKAQIENMTFADTQGSDIRMSASIEDIKEVQEIRIEVNATLQDAEKTIAHYLPENNDVKIPFSAGRTQIALTAGGDLDVMAVDASLRAQNLNAKITGNVQKPLGSLSIDELRFKANHPNYSDLVKLLVPAFKGYSQAQAVSVTADIDKTAEKLTLNNLKATIGQSDIHGSVSYSEGKARPYVLAELASDQLILDRLLPQSAGGSSKGKSSGKSSDQEFIWSRNAIDTSGLFAIDADVSASVKTLQHERVNASNVDIAAKLQNGALDIQKINANAFGGALSVTSKLSAADKDRSPLSLVSSVKVSDVDLEQMVYSFTGSRILKAKGRVSGETSLTSTGLSVAALIFDLGGKGSLQGQEITIIGMDLNKLARALTSMSSSWSSNISGLMDATISGGQTYFETLDGNFTIKEGIVTIPKMMFTGDQFGMNFIGMVDLPRWMVDAAAHIDVLEGEEKLTFSVPVKGSLSNPVKSVPQKLLSRIISERIGQDLINPLLNDLLGNKTPARQSTDGTTNGAVNDNAEPTQQQQRREIQPEDAIRGVIEGLF